MPKLTARAPAKINLSLHVLARRDDGLHALESLVAFAGHGDVLTLEPGPVLSLHADGPGAATLGDDENLVLRAARHLAERVEGLAAGAFHLTKRLPVERLHEAQRSRAAHDRFASVERAARNNGLDKSGIVCKSKCDHRSRQAF